MAWLLRGTRRSMILGGSVLGAITGAIGLAAAFSGRAADTWTYIAAGYFGVWIVVILLGL